MTFLYTPYPLKDIFKDQSYSDFYVRIAYNGFINPLTACILEQNRILVTSDIASKQVANHFTFHEFKSIILRYGDLETNVFFQNSHFKIFRFKEWELRGDFVLRVGAQLEKLS